MARTITDYAINHFHFSNLKRPLVIKVRCRVEMCNGSELTCLKFSFKLAVDNYCNYWKERWDRVIASALDSGPSGPSYRLAGDLVSCSLARHFTLYVPLSI